MRSLHYPIFLASRDLAPTLFWKKVFENLAYGDPPKGIYFKDQTLYSLTKKKEFNYNFADKSAENIYEEIFDLFTRVFGLKVSNELSKKKEIFDHFNQTNSSRRTEDTWSKIKKQSLKDNLIQDFVVKSQKIHELSKEQTQKLYFYVSVGLVFKLFLSGDVHIQNGAIAQIDGVEFENKNVYISREFKEPKIKKLSVDSVYLYELWESYLKSI